MLHRLAQRLGLSAIPEVFFIAAGVATVFVLFAIPFHREFAAFFATLGGFTFVYFGWFYILSVTGLLIFLVFIAASRYGDVRLGRDDERPEYSTFTWFCMLFAAGIGSILMFWGIAEPLSHFASPPIEGVEGGTPEAAGLAMNIALYHFGLHTWTIFTLPALAIGYFSYRRGLPMRISSVFYGVLGERIYGPIGWAIDIIAVLGTLFGVAVTLGLSTMQLNSGLSQLFGLPDSIPLQLLIISVITVIATISVVMGLNRGILRLSQINIVIALVILLFIWIAGPTLFLTSGIVESFGGYIQNLPWLAFWTDTYRDTGWQQSWTVFYWAWTISWAPYAGIFIARISRGRTIRQFIAGALGAPVLFSVIWFSVFGLAAIDLEMNQGVNLSAEVQQNVEVALFTFLDQFPFTLLISTLGVVVIMVFLTTSVDSAALVMDLLSRRDDQPSRTGQLVFWTLLLGGLTAALLLGGGLDALRNVITALGFPFCVLLVFMAAAVLRSLQQDAAAHESIAPFQTPKM